MARYATLSQSTRTVMHKSFVICPVRLRCGVIPELLAGQQLRMRLEFHCDDSAMVLWQCYGELCPNRVACGSKSFKLLVTWHQEQSWMTPMAFSNAGILASEQLLACGRLRQTDYSVMTFSFNQINNSETIGWGRHIRVSHFIWSLKLAW